jgi:hypothetical protein
LTFKDSFTLEIDFEIDRDRLLRHLLTQAKMGCFGLALPFCVLFALSFFNSHMAPYRNADMWFRLGWLSVYLLAGLVACAVFGSVLYFAYFGPSARLKAKNLRLMVDGPYLRLVSGGFVLLDQRFHFRDVSSYSTVQGPFLRRNGLKTLCFRVQGRSATPPLSVTGLIDADRVRDVLCEIDASRELPAPSVPDPSSTSADG